MIALPEFWLAFPFIGFFAGMISGSMGIGAGIIVVPTLVHLAYSQKEAQAMALCLMVPMALYGAYRYQSNPAITIDYKVVALLTVTALVGVYFGTSIANAVSGATLRKGFSILLAVVSIKMWLTA